MIYLIQIVLLLLHTTFIAVHAYMVHEGGYGCCVCGVWGWLWLLCACVRVGMWICMCRLACKSGIDDLAYVWMGVHRHGHGWVGWVDVDGHTHRWVCGMGVCVCVDIVSNLDTVRCEMDLCCADGPVEINCEWQRPNSGSPLLSVLSYSQSWTLTVPSRY